MMSIFLLLLSMILGMIGQFLLKKGVLSSPLEPNFIALMKTFISPYVILGFTMYGLSSISWLFVLKKLPLSIAYPTLSLSYIIIVIMSYFLFSEPLTPSKIIGVLLIMTGVIFLFSRGVQL